MTYQVKRFNGKNYNGRYLLTLVFASIMILSLGMSSQDVFSMGQQPGSCYNEYDGPITNATITVGNQTYYPLMNSVSFQIPNNKSYQLTYTIHTPNQNRQGNSLPGTVWVDTNVNNFYNGGCEGNVGPNENFTESSAFGHSSSIAPETSQYVIWGTTVNSFSYTVDWLCTSTTVPCKPTSLSSTSVSSSQINLNWIAPRNEGGSPVTGYKIDRTVVDPDGVYRNPTVTIVSNTNSTATSYSDTGLSQNTNYAYWVRAINSFGTGDYSSGASATTTTATTATTATLTLNPISPVPWGTTVTISGKLADSAGTGIGGKTVTFSGTGAANLGAITTSPDGTFTTSGTAPNTVTTDWQVNANFAGDSSYSASSATQSYNTIKHKVSLSLVISPSTVAANGTYSLSGKLKDAITGTTLSSKTITFTATTPITIPSTTTDSSGNYLVSGLKAPGTAGSYAIKAQFAGGSLYYTYSSTRTLSVT